MFANYTIILRPGPTGQQEGVELEDVEPAFNQMGWLIFTNHQREPIAFFTPDSVRYVVQDSLSAESIDAEIIDANADGGILIN